MIADVQTVEFAVKSIFHWLLYLYELKNKFATDRVKILSVTRISGNRSIIFLAWFFLQHPRLKIPEYYVADKLPHSLSRHPILKVILKCKNHPSIRIIKSFSRRFWSLYFLQVDKNIVLKEIRKLNMNKAVQDTDMPVKTLKENVQYFAEYICL